MRGNAAFLFEGRCFLRFPVSVASPRSFLWLPPFILKRERMTASVARMSVFCVDWLFEECTAPCRADLCVHLTEIHLHPTDANTCTNLALPKFEGHAKHRTSTHLKYARSLHVTYLELFVTSSSLLRMHRRVVRGQRNLFLMTMTVGSRNLKQMKSILNPTQRDPMEDVRQP